MSEDDYVRGSPAPWPGNWLTLEQIEARWGIKPTAVNTAIAVGKLPRARIGQAVLVEYEDLDAWIRSEKKLMEEKVV